MSFRWRSSLLSLFATGALAARIARVGQAGLDIAHLTEADGLQAFAHDEQSLTSSLRQRFEIHKSLGRTYLNSDAAQLPEGVSKTRYTDVVNLGSGNFGELWQAFDKSLNKTVALKLFYGTNSDGSRFHLTQHKAKADNDLWTDLQAAIQECTSAMLMEERASTNPKHASRIMKCYEDHASDGQQNPDAPLHLILEDCAGAEGVNLLSWITQQQQYLSAEATHQREYQELTHDAKALVDEILNIFKQSVEGLDFMAKAGYIHHDIKPENIMLKKDDEGNMRVKLIDFGGIMADSKENCKRIDTTASPLYAGPEWFNESGPNPGFSCDNPSSFDIYAIAVVLDEMLTGKTMFEKLSANVTIPDGAWMDECKQKMEPDCEDKWVFSQLKDEGGIEMKFLAPLMDPNMDVADKYDSIQRTLMHPAVPLPWEKGNPHVDVLARYLLRALDSKWYDTFIRMLAFDPEQRPQPAEVLSSPLLIDIQTETDSDPMAEKTT